MIEVNNLIFGYSKTENILKGITLNIDKGEIVNILGANGCGKSTLLKLILGFYKYTAGSIKIYGREVNSISRKELAKYLSYVPQSHHAVFPYTVKDVVIMGKSSGSFWKNYTSSDYEAVDYALSVLKIEHLKERDYSRLSGGERQLVMVARAIVQNSEYCFMDEPVASLDYGNQYRLLDGVKNMAGRGLTFIITTHHPDHVKYLGGRAVLMKNGLIYKDGLACNVLNDTSLYELYKVKVDEAGYVYAVD